MIFLISGVVLVGSVAVLCAGLAWDISRTRRILRDLPVQPYEPDAMRKAVADLGGPRLATKRLALCLRFSDMPWEERWVAVALAEYCGAPAVPLLIRALRDENNTVRLAAVDALREMGPTARDAVPALTERLYDKGPYISDAASWALAEIGPAAVPALNKVITEADGGVRCLAAYTRWRITGDAEEAMPVLIAGLRDEAPHVRCRAAQLLYKMGTAAAGAELELEKALADPEDEDVRYFAAKALRQLGRVVPPASAFPPVPARPDTRARGVTPPRTEPLRPPLAESPLGL